MPWQLQEAKQRFSELVRRAQEEGPQIVTRHGVEIVVVIDFSEYRHLAGAAEGFKEFLAMAPDLDELEIERSRQAARTVDLVDQA